MIVFFFIIRILEVITLYINIKVVYVYKKKGTLGMQKKIKIINAIKVFKLLHILYNTQIACSL